MQVTLTRLRKMMQSKTAVDTRKNQLLSGEDNEMVMHQMLQLIKHSVAPSSLLTQVSLVLPSLTKTTQVT